MKPIQILIPIALLACASLPAQDPAAPPAQGQRRPEPPEGPGHPPRRPGGAPCNASACPRQDQNGHPPTSCAYQSGMATGWRCILTCTYDDSQWGALVDSSLCD